MAGAISLRKVRYDNGGANHVFARNNGKPNAEWKPKDESNPYFTYDPPSALSAIAACARARRRKERSR
jgi:formate dehydrogenase major subunit